MQHTAGVPGLKPRYFAGAKPGTPAVTMHGISDMGLQPRDGGARSTDPAALAKWGNPSVIDAQLGSLVNA